jgi:hypothetical protein
MRIVPAPESTIRSGPIYEALDESWLNFNTAMRAGMCGFGRWQTTQCDRQRSRCDFNEDFENSARKTHPKPQSLPILGRRAVGLPFASGQNVRSHIQMACEIGGKMVN